MPIQHLPADSPCDKIFGTLERDGGVVIDTLLDRADIDQVTREMAPHLDAAPNGEDDFEGFNTQRAGMLIARSPKAREIIMNSTVLDVTAKLLAHSKTFQLSVTEVIRIKPESAAQRIHRDQWEFEGFPFSPGCETSLSTMWALTDFSEMNGATRVVPGSHKLKGYREFSEEECEPAKMEAGSVLLYTGSLFHGAGANESDSNRGGLIVHYNLGWLRQVENQYLGVPMETLREFPEELLRLMGYSRGDDTLGYTEGGRDPIVAVRPEFERSTSEFR